MASLQQTNTPYKFVECTKQNLDTFPITEGCVYFTDTGEIYIDEGGKRKSYGISEKEKAQIKQNKNDILLLKQSGIGGISEENFMYIYEELADVPCKSISIQSNLTFNGAGTQELIPILTPPETTDIVIWSSEPKGIVNISSSGRVTAVKNGKTTITATCGLQKATCEVTVTGITEIVKVTGVSLDRKTATVDIGKTITLNASIKPPNATNQNVTWFSDGIATATVENGVVKGIQKGTASISVTTEDGKYTDICNVTVNESVVSTYKNLFDKDTMIATPDQGINNLGVISQNYKWGLAYVPVEPNTQYSLKNTNVISEHTNLWYAGANNGAIGFCDSNRHLISYLSLGIQSQIDNSSANALLTDYTNTKKSPDFSWIILTTPKNCNFICFNTKLKALANDIQLEKGDTIHNYYLPYSK